MAEQTTQNSGLKEVGGFELLSKLGQGGMGAVFKARQKSLDRIVALKILPPSIAKDARFIERFQREARASAKLNHPHIVQGIDVGKDSATGLWYFAMELVEGPSLQQLLKEQKVIPEERALTIARDIARALECAVQNGIVHRDIKPDNILLTTRGEAKLADLGLAKQLSDDASVTQSGQSVGTPHYMSPEQVRGETRDIDIRSDIYALGGTLFHLVTGQTPFSGETSAVIMTKHLTETPPKANRVNPAVSEACARLIARMMQKKREQRVQSPKELVEQITKILDGEDTPTAGARAVARRPVRKESAESVRAPQASGSKNMALGAGALLVVAVAVVAAFMLMGQPSKTPAPPAAVKAQDQPAPVVSPPKVAVAQKPKPLVKTPSKSVPKALPQEVQAPEQPELKPADPPVAKIQSDTKAGKAATETVTPPAAATNQAETDDILIADFEDGANSGWKAEGDAFGVGTRVNRVTGFLGKKLINTYLRGETSTGTLTSPPFKIERKYIRFLIGGGNYPGTVGIQLMLDGKVVRSATGPSKKNAALQEIMNWHSWDVSEFAGKMATLQIIDQSIRLWGHTLIDHVLMSNNEPLETEKAVVALKPPDEKESAAAKKEKELAAAAEARSAKARELFANVRKESALLLAQNKFAEATALLDKKIKDPALADVEELLKQERADLGAVAELRKQAVGALRAQVGKQVVLKKGAGTIKGKVVAENREGVTLNVGGPEMTINADQIHADDIDQYAPAIADATENLRTRGLMFLYSGNIPKAKDYFAKASGAGATAAVEPYLDRIMELELGEVEATAQKAWENAEKLFAAQNMKAAKEAYDSFVTEYGKTKTAEKQAPLLKQRHDAIEAAAWGTGIPATLHWIIADDADVYLNGVALRQTTLDFRTRPDEAYKPFQADVVLKRGDIITVGGRRGGSYGITMFALSKNNRVIFKTDTTRWKVYFPAEEDEKKWYLPEVLARAKTSKVTVQPIPFPTHKKLKDEHNVEVECIWDNPLARTAYLYGVVE